MRQTAVLLLALAMLAGCLSGPGQTDRLVRPADVGHDPATVHVTGTRLVAAAIPSWDGETELAALVHSPKSSDQPNGSPARWPVVVFLHGWGGGKESFSGGRGGVPGSDQAAQAVPASQQTDRLQAFAQAGFIAVAYDARGFGESGGHTDIAGPATMADLTSVLDWVEARYATNGLVGLVGQSYGAGQALLAWSKDPRITTAVPMYGWVDLADGLVPNNVPKLEWAQFLYAYGLLGAHGRYDPMLHDWYTRLYTRDDMVGLRAQMATRSAGNLAATEKPLLICQGLQETLFPQADRAWDSAGGFTRAYLYAGGHGGGDEGCWERALAWFQFFLAGHDTRVDAWPPLETVDATGQQGGGYSLDAPTAARTWHLRAPDLAASPSPQATFTVRQSPTLPTGEPSALSDLLGGVRQPRPDALRTDPAATTFTTGPLDAGTVFGAPRLNLRLQAGEAPFQVASSLFRVTADGTSHVLGHAAFAALGAEDLDDGWLRMRFEWTHAKLDQGDRIQLMVAANDEGHWMPLLESYEVSFGGDSWLELPFLA